MSPRLCLCDLSEHFETLSLVMSPRPWQRFIFFFHFFKDVKKKFLGVKNYDSHHRFPLEKIVFSQ